MLDRPLSLQRFARADDTPADEKVDLVIWHWQDKRLQSQQQVQETLDRNFYFLEE